MFGDNKYSNVLTVFLVIVIAAIIGLLIFLGVDVYKKYYIEKETSQGVEQFNNKVPNTNILDNTVENDNNNTVESDNTIENDPLENLQKPNENSGNNGGNNSDSDGLTFKGYPMIGTITIPKTSVTLPILSKVTKDSIEKSVARQYGLDLNKPGNVVIVGHNYQNGLFFSNNKKLEVGDKIYIKDTSGVTLTYTIYSKFETAENDASFYDRDTNGKCEITLSTCVDNNPNRRLILLAKE